MKTETLELTKTELDYLLSIVYEHIDSGVYWGNHAQFVKMQNRVLTKISEAYDMAYNHKVKS
jgi:glutathionyl-hydroquinone reductase